MKRRMVFVALATLGLLLGGCSGSGLDGVIDPVDGLSLSPEALDDASLGDVIPGGGVEGTINCIQDNCDVAICLEDTACAEGVACMAACNGAECAGACIADADSFIQPALEQTLICATFAGCFDLEEPPPEPEPEPYCGDGVCDEGEDPKTCGADCAPDIAPCLTERCGAPPGCDDDGACAAAVECIFGCADLACAEACVSAAEAQNELAAWVSCGADLGCFDPPSPPTEEPVCGDGVCEADESCPEDCEAPKPPPSDCCDANGGFGCDDTLCNDAVCAEDPYCCEVEWDINCAELAQTICPGCIEEPGPEEPICGDGVCDGPEDCLEDCEEPSDQGSCCIAGDGPGCLDDDCAKGICDFMPECCDDVWSDSCAQMATERCEVCQGGCGDGVCAPEEDLTCPEDCEPVVGPQPGSCCEASSDGATGCNDAECTDAVCAEDPYCCEVEWDTACAEAAGVICEVCGAGPGPVEPPEPPEEGCLEAACEVGACVAYDECAAALSCMGDCGDSAACALACAAETSFAFQGALFGLVECGVDAGCFEEESLPVCGDGVCEPGETDCDVDCDKPPEPVAPGDCCVASGGNGCDDEACTSAVCEADPYCCQVEWDGACAEQAAGLCEVCGAGPVGPICGDGACLGGESNATCPQDCPGEVDSCGDFYCSSGENGFNCPQDCNGLDDFGACIHDECGQTLDACILYSEGCFVLVACTQQCGDDQSCNEACIADADPVSLALFNQLRVCIGENCIDAPPSESICGDGQCDIGELCPEDCELGPVCGDGFCGGGETEFSCPEDCEGGLNTCGDGFCSSNENGFNCPQDCEGLNPFDECVTDECGEQLDTCILYDEGCYTLVACLQACDGNEECSFGCYATVDALAMAIHGGLVQCIEQNCVDGPGPGPEEPELSPAAQCLVESCETGECTNFPPCVEAIECVANCDSFDCINTCIDEGPPPAQNILQSAAFCGISAGCINVEEVEGPTCGDGVCEGVEVETCPEDCFDEPEPGVSNCCEPSEEPGCNPPPGDPCEEIVCSEDPYCCDTAFDDICADIAQAVCEICQPTGPPGAVCGDGICEVGEDCDADCLPPEPDCGDGVCEVGEDCPEDCEGPKLEGCLVDFCPDELEDCVDEPGCNEALPCLIDCVEAGGFECTFVCMPEPFNDTLYELGVCGGEAGCGNICGDGSCGVGESYAMCPQDCPPDEGPICGDGICEVGEICQQDCAPEPDFECGDGVCEVGEICPEDCAPAPEPVCGDGECEPGEDCPEDCFEPTEPGDCCSESGGQGCIDDACTEAICEFDGFCCETAWDQQCANEANELCEVCGGSDSECGDGVCTPDESIESCPSDCEPPPPGSCCEPSGGQGCVDSVCTAAVCDLDPFCCEANWDDLCAEQAQGVCEACGASAVCGDGLCFADEDCPEDCGGQTVESCIEEGCPDEVAICNEDPACAGALACVINCVEGGGQQCTTSCMPQPYNDALYAVGVCGAQAGCGNVCGDGVCSPTESADICPTDCEQEDECGDGVCTDDEGCSSCPADCGDCDGSCCDSHGGLGCDNLECQQAVCQANLDCCYEGWTDECAAIAKDVCDVCQDDPTGPVCGDGECSGGENDANCPLDCGGSGVDFFGCIIDSCGAQTEACFDDPDCADAFPCLEECVNNGGSQCTLSCMPEPYNDTLYQLGVCGGQSGCGNICGDGACGPGESSSSCPEDCDVNVPDDGYDAEACLIDACGSDSACPSGTDCGPTLACMYTCDDEQCAKECVDDSNFLTQLFLSPVLDCAAEQGCYDADGAVDTCGDGTCSPSESCETCEADCGSCQSSYDCVVDNCDFQAFGITCSTFPECNDILICVSECPDTACADDCDGGLAASLGFGDLMEELVSCTAANACFSD